MKATRSRPGIVLGTLMLVAPLAAQLPFTLSGPTLVDFSQLPRDASSNYIVRFSGSGFTSQMLLAVVGPQGPVAIAHQYVDGQTIMMVLPQPLSVTIALELYKLDNQGSIYVTPRLTTQFIVGNELSQNAVYVATNGSDSGPGTLTAPYRSIGRGLQAVSPGKTLYLRGGTYLETPDIAVSGTASQPITIQSFPGEMAVIDSGPKTFRTRGNKDWELVNAATGEYRSLDEEASGAPYGYVVGIAGYDNGRVGLVPYVDAAAFRSTSETYVNAVTPFYCGPGLFHDPATGRLHIRLQKTADVRAMEARYGQVFATDTPDPRQYSILVSQAFRTLTIRGSNLVIRNLCVHQATHTISLPNTVSNVLIDNVEAWLGDSCIDSSGAGSHHIAITRCRAYGDVPRWIFWTDAKEPPAPADLMRQTSISFGNGAHDIEIAYNHVRGGHDLIGVDDDEDNVSIHHNVLENCHDDAIELEGTTDIGRIDVAYNYVVNAFVAVSPGQDTPLTTGPILIHHNVFADLRNPPVNRVPGIVSWNGGGRFGFEYMLKQHSGNTFYYHNTMVQYGHSGRGINITPARPADTYCMNNILVMVNGKVNGSYQRAAGQRVDGNLYWKVNTVDTAPLSDGYDTIGQLHSATGLEQFGIGTLSRRGTDPQFAGFSLAVTNPSAAFWELTAASEGRPITAFLLASGSPAISAALAIPSHPVFGELPEANASGDLGAIPFGTADLVFGGFPFNQVQ